MKTEILVITDRSGSMSSIQSDVDGGFNTFIKEQQAVHGEARVTFVQFDTEIETVYAAKPLAEVPPLKLVPRGSTALLDAMGQTLNVQGKRIADEKWADLVIVVIITDGEENASREYGRDQIKTMVTHAEANGWKFVFLAANQDAFAAGASMGISAAMTRNFVASAAGTAAAYSHASLSAASLRTGMGDPS